MGLLDIGYHVLVERDGTVAMTRPINSMGAHTPGFNHCSVGVCLIGGADDDWKPADNFTVGQARTLGRLLADLHRIYPWAELVGHSEIQRVGRKDPRPCPSINMDKLRDLWSSLVKSSLFSSSPTSPGP